MPTTTRPITALAAEQDDPAVPGRGPRDQRIEDGEFGVPAYERARAGPDLSTGQAS